MPPEGDKQSCRHRVTVLVEYNIVHEEGGSQRRKKELPFPLVCLVFRSDHAGLTLDLY